MGKIRTRGNAPNAPEGGMSLASVLCQKNDSLVVEERQFIQYLNDRS